MPVVTQVLFGTQPSRVQVFRITRAQAIMDLLKSSSIVAAWEILWDITCLPFPFPDNEVLSAVSVLVKVAVYEPDPWVISVEPDNSCPKHGYHQGVLQYTTPCGLGHFGHRD